MTNYMTNAEAEIALRDVEQARQRVIDQIGMPRWYWWGGLLIVLAGVTIAAGFAAYYDGAEHPSTIASVFVAALVLLGGPRVMAAVRTRARRADGE